MPVRVGCGNIRLGRAERETGIAGGAFSPNTGAIAKRHPVTPSRTIVGMTTLRPGDIVVMDNLGSHKSSAVPQALRAAGTKLFFLPKYSPDLNPIEMLFAKLKHGLRKAAKRTEQAIYDALVDLLPAVPSTECANYFAHAGYART